MLPLLYYFLSKGTDVSASNMFGDIALHRATRRGHAAVVKFLVNSGVDMMTVDEFGYTALNSGAQD